MKTDSRPAYVLDSFAVLSLLEGEPGADAVRAILDAAGAGQAEVLLCVVNYGEALYITERERGLEETHRAIAAVEQWPLRLVDADRPLALSAAHFKARFPISYADAFALALAQAHRAKVVTGDPEFRKTEAVVPVEWLPR